MTNNMPCRNTVAERIHDKGDAPAEQEARRLERYGELIADCSGISEIIDRLRDGGDRLEYALFCELRTNPRSEITRLLTEMAAQMAEESATNDC